MEVTKENKSNVTNLESVDGTTRGSHTWLREKPESRLKFLCFLMYRLSLIFLLYQFCSLSKILALSQSIRWPSCPLCTALHSSCLLSSLPMTVMCMWRRCHPTSLAFSILKSSHLIDKDTYQVYFGTFVIVRKCLCLFLRSSLQTTVLKVKVVFQSGFICTTIDATNMAAEMINSYNSVMYRTTLHVTTIHWIQGLHTWWTRGKGGQLALL